jgi:hypothetical protein
MDVLMEVVCAKKKAKRNESGIETVRLRKVRGSEMSVGHVWGKSRQNMR